MKSKKLKLGQIDLKMCKDYDLIQAMDYDFKTKEVINKGRGFAVTVVKIQGLTFLIPFRSYIPKKYQLKYKLRNSAKEGYVEGLDIGKTLILEDKSYLLNTTFRLRKIEDYYKVMDNDKAIINKLVKAIIDYNRALEINDRNKLEDPKRFKFSTFQNYSTRLKVITENCKLLLDNNCGFLLFFQINMAEVLLQCDENLYVNQVKIVSLEG